ncbi:unnamed protein product [Mytilus edulis]|uniref:EF-hand domain-containing protein n=1 Tax=Mytilus edulis TaxID=6550 RepID=A0A8S3S020_MYTED|nr:unnamed protein product [Mytilus edulis]
MWTSIKQIIKDSMEKHVPTKTSLARQSHPWMNTQLRRLSKQKQRAYSKAKLTNSTKDWKRYKNIKAELQRESRRAHTKFMQNIVSDDLYKNPKRFWSYIKSRKQESRFAPLDIDKPSQKKTRKEKMASQENQSSIFLDVFRRADKKDNGQISWEEFVSFFADGVMGKEELETLFKQIDTHNTKEVTNQVSALQLPLESASEGMDELAKEESGDTKPVEASDVLKKSDITPGRVGRRAKRQGSNQSQNSIFDGTMSTTLTAQVDRLSTLLDRLEHGVNTDGFVDEDLEALASDKYYLVEFETNIKGDSKEVFRKAMRTYIEGANNAEGCLSTCVRYYKDIGSFALYEIWDSEENFKKYNSDGTKFSVQMKEYIDGPVNNKCLDFPASWWKKNA